MRIETAPPRVTMTFTQHPARPDAIGRDQFPVTDPVHDWVRYVRPVLDPQRALTDPAGAQIGEAFRKTWGECWSEFSPHAETDGDPYLIVPRSLRAGHILEWNISDRADWSGGTGYTASSYYYVVQSVTVRRVELVVFGQGLDALKQARTYVVQNWGRNFTPEGLEEALTWLLASTTGRGAQCADILLRAIAAGSGDPVHDTVVTLAQDYVANQRPRS